VQIEDLQIGFPECHMTFIIGRRYKEWARVEDSKWQRGGAARHEPTITDRSTGVQQWMKFAPICGESCREQQLWYVYP